jgi:hypothetical protein
MNETYNYYYPLFAMVFLTFIVAVKMFSDRMREMKIKKLRLRTFATSKDRDELDNVQAADNFKNLFECPILFYILTILLIQMNNYRPFYLTLMWAFVVARYAHSLIHCSYNKVLHRFYAFVSSFFILVFMWAIFFFEILVLGNRHV